MGIITKDEWVRRYSTRLVESGSCAMAAAYAAACVAVEHADDWASPEAAADEEIARSAAQEPAA